MSKQPTPRLSRSPAAGFGPSPETCSEPLRMASAIGLAGGSIEDATGHPAFLLRFNCRRASRAAAETAQTHQFPATHRRNYLHGRPNLEDTIRRTQSSPQGRCPLRPGLPSSKHPRGLRLRLPTVNVQGPARRNLLRRRTRAVGVKRNQRWSAFGCEGRSSVANCARVDKDLRTRPGAKSLSYADRLTPTARVLRRRVAPWQP